MTINYQERIQVRTLADHIDGRGSASWSSWTVIRSGGVTLHTAHNGYFQTEFQALRAAETTAQSTVTLLRKLGHTVEVLPQ